MRIALVISLLATIAIAEPLVEFVGEPSSTLSGVPIYDEADITLPGETESTRVYLTGAGLYKERVIFFDVDVYVITSYTDNPNGVSASDPLQSLRDSQLEMVQMTMKRSVTKDQSRTHMEDAFVINGVDVSEPETIRLLNSIRASNTGDVNTLIGIGPNEAETLLIEYPNETVFGSVAPNRALNQWKVWFGEPLNTNMGNVKKAVLGLFTFLEEIFI